MRRSLRFRFLWVLSFLVCSTSFGDWLTDQQQPDGSFANSSGVATSFQSTAESIRTLRLLGRNSEIGSANAYLTAQPYHGTEYLSLVIVANADMGTPVPTLVAELLTHQNQDGGFGENAGYGSTPADTAFALEALFATGQTNSTQASYGVGYMLQRQAMDGAWTNSENISDVYVTAISARALYLFKSNYAGVSAAIANAGNFIFSRQLPNNSWGENQLSAHALLTLALTRSDVTGLQPAAAALRGMQQSDGSWLNDVYTTALAQRALKVYDARNTGGDAAVAGGSVSGYIFGLPSNEPLANASVSIPALAGTSVHTNSAGFFVVNGIPAGNQTLSISKDGYQDTTAAAIVRNAQVADVGDVYLSQLATTARLKGNVFDATNNLPLGSVAVTLTGAQAGSVVTTVDGAFEFSALVPGHYSIGLEKSGYVNLAGEFDAVAGSSLTFQQGMTPQNVYLDPDPTTLQGQIINGTTDTPLSGASIVLDAGTTALSSADGSFSFSAIARGDHQLIVSANGFQNGVYSFVLPPGASGDLRQIKLYPVVAAGGTSPTTLSIAGQVLDSLDNHPLVGASVVVSPSGASFVTNGEGRFTATGLPVLSFSLTVSADNHETRVFNGTASTYGEIAATLPLPPLGASDTATSSNISGIVRASGSDTPVAGAQIEAIGTGISTTSAADGSFTLSGIESLGFTLQASAPGYQASQYSVQLTGHGSYSMDMTLVPGAAGSGLQVLSFVAQQTGTAANTTQTFLARVANAETTDKTAVVLADIVDASGVVVATSSPYAPTTTTPASSITFAAGQTVELTVPWNTAQVSPGTYQVVLRLVEPGTISRDLPSGSVLDSSAAVASVIATSTFGGQIGVDPPLTQAGTSTPVAFTAVVINTGNVPMTGAGFTLTVTDPTTGQVLISRQAVASLVSAGGSEELDFGSWIPSAIGNLNVVIHADDSAYMGSISGVLYVGDKANAAFTVDKSVVPLGTQNVHAKVVVSGVDVRTSTSTDPLFAAVKDAVRRGGLFVGPNAKQWSQTNRCLGCHIQSQSFYGMASSMDKASIDPVAVQYLYNQLSGTLQGNGVMAAAYLQSFPQTQTTLAAWAMSQWHSAPQKFRALYKASSYLLSRAVTSGTQSWWNYDHCSVWVCNVQGQTMTAVKGIVSTLQAASELGTAPVNDYVFDDSGYDFGIANMVDFKVGPDGWIWYLDASGTLSARNLTTGTTRVIASGLGSTSTGLAVANDGTAYVSSNSVVTKIAPGGAKTTVFNVSPAQSLYIALGPDGLLYVADNTRIWRISVGGVATQFVSGGLISRPAGMEFDADGTMYVANNGGWNILKVSPAGAVSIFADGLPFQPVLLRRASDGFLYAMTTRYNNNGFAPSGVLRIDGQGYIERLPTFDAPNSYGFNAMSTIGGDLYVHNASNHRLYKLRTTTLATPQLAQMQAVLANAARYTLAAYNDNNTFNDMHAMRLVTLAEARTQITDAALLSQINTAMNSIATVLRSRQRADGGWTYTTGRSVSDPYTTAFVGLALDYTNPSVNDPAIRNAITYLLASQTTDGSWPFQNGVFTTKLGPTSFVMAYLPKALERLGGIDTDLNIAVPANVVLSNPNVAPTTQGVDSKNNKTYKWSMQGVTTQARNVEFDLTLQNMAYQEARAVVSSAYLEFSNSFTGEKLHSDVTVPVVRATSALALSVATAQSAYAANTDVSMAGTVNNVGPPVTAGQVHLYIKASDGTAVADLGTRSFGALATNGTIAVPFAWNTGAYLAGDYLVYGQLYNQAGQLVYEDTASFRIINAVTAVAASITADKPVYQAWDTVNLQGRVRNASINVVQPAGISEVTVTTPGGQRLFTATYPVSELSPGALRDLTDLVKLVDMQTGDYPVTLVVKDNVTRAVVATASTSFHVQRDDTQALNGKVAVASTRVYQGDANLCTDTVVNLSAIALPGVTLTRTLVSLTTQAVIGSDNLSIDFDARQSQTWSRSVATTGLPLGGYACVLTATFNGTTKQLGAVGFDVVEPPIKLASSLQTGNRGRLLVLLDGSPEYQCKPATGLELWAPFGSSLPPDASVSVELLDGNDKRVDIETVLLSAYGGTINRSVGKGADLSIVGVSPEVITLQINAGSALPAGYHIVTTAVGDSMPPIVLDSGVLSEPCGCKAGAGSRYGDYEVSGVYTYDGSAPQKLAQVPTLTQRRAFLEQVLKAAGWSYHIETDAEGFTREMRTGAYSQYALFTEHEKLDEQAQKELREAVYRGEGLLDAGEHDQRHHGFDAALGIKWIGKHASADSVELLNSDIHAAAIAPLFSTHGVQRIQLAGATRVAEYRGSGHVAGGNDEAAVTTYTYGLGKSVNVGYDLLSEATLSGSASVQADVLRNALGYTSPGFAVRYAGQVVPLTLSVQNQGVAVAGQVMLPLPVGVEAVDVGNLTVNNGVLSAAFNMAVDQTAQWQLWVRLPQNNAGGSVTFDTDIQVVRNGAYSHYADAPLTLTYGARPTLADAQALADTSPLFKQVGHWLIKAQNWLDKGRAAFALSSLVQATDEVRGVQHAESASLRWRIDEAIWALSRDVATK